LNAVELRPCRLMTHGHCLSPPALSPRSVLRRLEAGSWNYEIIAGVFEIDGRQITRHTHAALHSCSRPTMSLCASEQQYCFLNLGQRSHQVIQTASTNHVQITLYVTSRILKQPAADASRCNFLSAAAAYSTKQGFRRDFAFADCGLAAGVLLPFPSFPSS